MKVTAELEQEVSHQTLEISGTIPGWLSGTLVRNGPIQVTVNGVSNAHWFDGLAMLHAFSFDQGVVKYTNRFLRSEAYHEVFEEGSLRYAGFAVDPCRSLFQKFLTFFSPQKVIHNANVNVAKFFDDYVALTETPLPVRFDPHTLQTLGLFDFQDKLPQEGCWESAHPHAVCNYLVEFGRKCFYVLYHLEEATRKVIAKIPVDKPAYMHSFAITDNYAILTEFPFVVNAFDLMTGKKPFIKNYTWQPERGTRFTVVNRHSGQLVGQYLTRPFFAFHHVNAFEEGESIHLDIITYKDAQILLGDNLYIGVKHPSNKQDPSQLERFTLKSGEIHSQVLFASSNEFPRINDAYDGKPYRYLYSAAFNDALIDKTATEGLYKINTQTKEVLTWSQEGCSSGEPVFVPAPNTQTEDDGVILALILDRPHNSSFLLILDAKTFQEIGRARAPFLIPEGLHGQYFRIKKKNERDGPP